MRVKTALTSLALVAGLTFSGSAYAAMINGAEIPENEMAAVQQRCDELKVADDTQSLTTSSESNSSTDEGKPSDTGDDAIVDNAPAVNEAADATTTINLDEITLQACMDAGLSM